MIYTGWAIVALNYPPYTEKVCGRVAITEFVTVVAFTLVSQTFFVARLYALSKESRKMLVTFGILTAAQFGIGVALIVRAKNITSFDFPTAASLICIPDSKATFDMRVVYSFSSLAYDAVSTMTLLLLSYLACGPRLDWPTILKTIMRDSALYFVAILASHFIVVLFLIVDRNNERYFSTIGIQPPLAQILVSRLVLSIRKAADQKIEVTAFISGELSFCRNLELLDRSGKQTELTDSPTSSTPTSPDIC